MLSGFFSRFQNVCVIDKDAMLSIPGIVAIPSLSVMNEMWRDIEEIHRERYRHCNGLSPNHTPTVPLWQWPLYHPPNSEKLKHPTLHCHLTSPRTHTVHVDTSGIQGYCQVRWCLPSSFVRGTTSLCFSNYLDWRWLIPPVSTDVCCVMILCCFLPQRLWAQCLSAVLRLNFMKLPHQQQTATPQTKV